MNARKKILIAKLKAQIRLRELMEKRNVRNYGIDNDQQGQHASVNSESQEGLLVPDQRSERQEETP